MLRGQATASTVDALGIAIIFAALLALLPIGFVSGDAIAAGASFQNSTWALNPNHLLMEPVGYFWYAGQRALGIQRESADILVGLDILAGVCALALFRSALAPRITESRAAANIATVVMAGSSAFGRLWISGEPHMLQLPFVVLVAAHLASCTVSLEVRRAASLGAVIGVAALFYVSNILLVVGASLALAVVHFKAERAKLYSNIAALSLAAATVAFGVFSVSWFYSAPNEVGFLEWLSSYGGSGETRLANSYGIRLSVDATATAIARAGYGLSSALVDLSPSVDTLRARTRDVMAYGPRIVVFLVGCAALYALALAQLRASPARPANRALLAVCVCFAIAYLPFAVFWDTSDDQFYFHFSVVFGSLACGTVVDRKVRSGVLAALVLVVVWNAWDLDSRFIDFPRLERQEVLLEALESVDVVIVPGQEEVDHLMAVHPALRKKRVRRITAYALGSDWAEGRLRIQTDLGTNAQNEEEVAIVDVFGVHSARHPWKYLDRLGFSIDSVQSVLMRAGPLSEIQHAGPYTIRKYNFQQ